MAMSGSKREHQYYLLSQQLLRIGTAPQSDADCRETGISELIRIDGMSRAWEEGDAAALHRRISNALAGLAAAQTKFAFVVASDGQETGFYLGTEPGCSKMPAGVFAGVLQDVQFSAGAESLVSLIKNTTRGMYKKLTARCGGYITGMPCIPAEGEKYLNPVETIITGMKGTPFMLLYLCEAADPAVNAAMLSELYANKGSAAREEQYSVAGSSMEERTITVVNYACRQFLKDLERVEEHLRAARDTGAWRMSGWFLGPDEAAGQRLAGLLRSAYSGANAGPEPVVCHQSVAEITWYMGRARYLYMPSSHPLAVRDSAYANNALTPLSSAQLAAFLMLPDRETAGFFINEEARFDLTARRVYGDGETIALGDILQSPYADDAVGSYRFPHMDFSRHVLVVGATGGGKSNTIRSMLRTLHAEKGIPFMVIESAKSEYWELSGFTGFEKLCVMPLGEMSSPFRLNPFECTEGFSLQTHVDALLSTFKAAFDMYTPMPFILEQAVYEVYRDYGWDVSTGANARRVKRYPTLADLYWQIPITVEGTAYDKEIRDNVTGALQTRVKSLMIGGKGQMLNVRSSTPLDRLLTLPVVLELESLGDDETKAFTIGLMMNRLYEYRRVKSAGGSRDFEHLLIIEEAHRLLKRVAPAENSSSAASVEFFCNMLSEIRSYGQGIMIADQSPMKLAQDAVRNTNLKVVHRMVDQEDRQAVGGAMHMNDKQCEALSMLRRGVGAVYAEGDNRPKLVKFPLVKRSRAANRAGVLRAAEGVLSGGGTETSEHPCTGCRNWTGRTCRASAFAATAKQVAEYALGPVRAKQSADYLERFRENGPDPRLVDAIIDYGVRQYAASRGSAPEAPDRFCTAASLAAALYPDDPRMAALITARYGNELERK
ncbi:MAG: ATP-binding protein [Clostridia bacterium]|nr:ATP-binding protein [Clostridia bacterium]